MMRAKEDIVVDLVRKRVGSPHGEPLGFGAPFARGLVRSVEGIELCDATGAPLSCQLTPLASWPDGSVRWALVDLLLATDGRTHERVVVRIPKQRALRPLAGGSIHLREDAGAYTIDTGAAVFSVDKNVFAPFAACRRSTGSESVACSAVRLQTPAHQPLVPRLERVVVETPGPVRLTLRGEGEFRPPRGKPFCRFAVRQSFFAGTGMVRVDFTLHNPRRARHPGGVWDLGDPGSVHFSGLSIGVRTLPAGPHGLAWRASADTPEAAHADGRIEIYQASSGGENWRSANHVDRNGRVPLEFRGCRITHGERVDSVDRADPVLSWSVPGVRITAAVTKFWQQFPTALVGGEDGLEVGLFPRQVGEPFELQGGEQKTHTVFLLCEPGVSNASTAGLDWVHDPLVPCVSPDDFAASDAIAYFVPAAGDPHTDYVRLVQKAVDGPDSFFRKREAIDEYGWRNFGDTWADHEDVFFTGAHPVISHYNNQYDLLYGFLLHFARSGDPRWFELAADLARHVIDIDLYHTAEDKPAYNGGLFWHTDHYQGAGRATHRSYTADSPLARAGREYGGGPSNENNYTTGLLYFYFLTGDPAAGEAVRGLADWVLRMDDGSGSLLGHLDAGPTGVASRTRDDDYHGPGRGAGNSVNALIDAFALTGERCYLDKAEELIARSVHPRDDPERWNLLDPETRWSYLIFLQALGKYLDLKCERAECDAMFAYARASLLRYAGWMLDHETPFLTRGDRLVYPTESWPAHDMRKSCVFDYAARYGPLDQRARLTEKAETFFAESLRGVLSFPGCTYTRPLAVLLSAGALRAGFRLHPPAAVEFSGPEPKFGEPARFIPQKNRVRRRLRTLSGLLAVAGAAVRPSVLRRVLSGRIW